MPRVCTICTSSDRPAIEQALVAGTSYRLIASQYYVGYKSVERHVPHISKSVLASKQAQDEAQALDVVAQLREINDITRAILYRVKDDKKQQWVALHAIDRVCHQLELQAKLLGDIDQAAQIDITLHTNCISHAEWKRREDLIVDALVPYVDARIAVAEALIGRGE